MKNKKVVYGRLTVISKLFRRKGNGTHSYVRVRCVCGVEKEARLDLLVIGKIKSCGCLAGEIKKKLLKRYGRLTVISEPYRRYDVVGRAMYVDVLCDCGVKKYVKAISLKSNITQSCGCLVVDANIKTHTTHGLTKHPLMKVWSGIIQRCTNPNDPNYKNYGGRGVAVCKEWLSDFFSFYKWAIKNGWKKGLEVDKDKIPHKLGISSKSYNPKMCSILTKKENLMYRRKIV